MFNVLQVIIRLEDFLANSKTKEKDKKDEGMWYLKE